MTKDKVLKIIKKYNNILEYALKLDANVELGREEVKELHAITTLAYYYLTGEDLQKEPYKNSEKKCENCNHYGKLSLECGRCDGKSNFQIIKED